MSKYKSEIEIKTDRADKFEKVISKLKQTPKFYQIVRYKLEDEEIEDDGKYTLIVENPSCSMKDVNKVYYDIMRDVAGVEVYLEYEENIDSKEFYSERVTYTFEPEVSGMVAKIKDDIIHCPARELYYEKYVNENIEEVFKDKEKVLPLLKKAIFLIKYVPKAFKEDREFMLKLAKEIDCYQECIPNSYENDLPFFMALKNNVPDARFYGDFSEVNELVDKLREKPKKPKNVLIADVRLRKDEQIEKIKIGDELIVEATDGEQPIIRSIDKNFEDKLWLIHGDRIINDCLNNGKIKEVRAKVIKIYPELSELKVALQIIFADNKYNIDGIDKIKLVYNKESAKRSRDKKIATMKKWVNDIIYSYNLTKYRLRNTNEGTRIDTNEHLKVGQKVYLKRNYENPHNNTAVEVFTLDGGSIGFLGGYCYEEVAQVLDTDIVDVTGEIVEYTSVADRKEEEKRYGADIKIKIQANIDEEGI
ncbi:MAG: hypothetical protein IKL68_00955 [Clostridia bacterium]|nr:hypothetical protein [Clostridia bacterium]